MNVCFTLAGQLAVILLIQLVKYIQKKRGFYAVKQKKPLGDGKYRNT
jgi:hypothetical protein